MVTKKPPGSLQGVFFRDYVTTSPDHTELIPVYRTRDRGVGEVAREKIAVCNARRGAEEVVRRAIKGDVARVDVGERNGPDDEVRVSVAVHVAGRGDGDAEPGIGSGAGYRGVGEATR